MKYWKFIHILERDRLYSPYSIVRNGEENGLFEEAEAKAAFSDALETKADREAAKKKVLQSLRQFRINNLKHVEKDGIVEHENRVDQGWYGWRWQGAMQPRYFSETEREAIEQARVDHDRRRQQAQAMSLPDTAVGCEMPAEAEAPGGDDAPPSRGHFVFEFKLDAKSLKQSGFALAGVMMVMLAFLVYLTRSQDHVFRADSDPTIAVLQCENDTESGIVLPSILHKMLDSGIFMSTPHERMQLVETAVNQCERPSRSDFDALSAELDVDFLLWGELEQDGHSYVWHGVLYQRNAGSRRVRAQAGTYLLLVDEIVRACLRLLEIEDDVGSSAIFFSANNTANELYTEARALAGQGKIAAARELFRRAGSLDPHFYSAQIEWATALYKTGYFRDATQILEDLAFNQGEHLPPLVLLESYKHLAKIYFREHQNEAFGDVAAKGQALAARYEITRDYLYFLLLELRFLAATGRFDRDLSVAVNTIEMSHPDDVESRVSIMLYKSFLARSRNDLQTAYDHLVEAREHAARHHLLSEEIMITIKMVQIALLTGDADFISTMCGQLEEAESLAEKTGNILDSLEISYWLARCAAALGQPEREHALLEEVILEAGHQGYFRLEILAGLRVVKVLLKQGRHYEAERMVGELQAKNEALPPLYRLWIENRWVHVYFFKGEYEKALEMAQKNLVSAEALGNGLEIARALNNSGEVLERLDRIDEALDCYKRAYQLKLEYGDPSLAGTALNLKRLYEGLGEPEHAADFTPPKPNPQSFWWRSLK